jgi:hypothetical protein
VRVASFRRGRAAVARPRRLRQCGPRAEADRRHAARRRRRRPARRPVRPRHGAAGRHVGRHPARRLPRQRSRQIARPRRCALRQPRRVPGAGVHALGQLRPLAQPRQRPLRPRHPDRDIREHGWHVLPRVPAPGADRRPHPRRLRRAAPPTVNGRWCIERARRSIAPGTGRPCRAGDPESPQACVDPGTLGTPGKPPETGF